MAGKVHGLFFSRRAEKKYKKMHDFPDVCLTLQVWMGSPSTLHYSDFPQ